MRHRFHHPVIALVCLLSGASGLIYQSVWTRRMTLVAGSTAGAVSLVLAVFMGGLALGSWRFGRAADETRDPLGLYARLELAIAAFGLLSVPVLEWLAYSSGLGAGLRAAAACAALLIPAVLMGGTLPVLIKAASPDARDDDGGEPGRLYALNTLGAVAGTLLATFVLIERFGLRASVGAAALGNLAAGVAALILARAHRRGGGPARPSPKSAPFAFSTALAVAALAGFLGLAAEVLWTRHLIPVLGDNSVHAFGTMLAAYLAGLVVGGAAAARLAGWVEDDHVALGTALALGGAATLAGTAILARLAEGAPPGVIDAGGHFLQCLAILLVPAAISGAVLPLAVRFEARGVNSIGGGFGLVYAVNTAGAIAGALAGGFVILPWLGVRAGLFLLAAIGVASGLALLLRRGGSARVAFGGTTMVALAAAFVAYGAGDPGRRFAAIGQDLVFYQDGPESTISVGRARGGHELTLFVDWRDQAHTKERFQIHLRLLGHLPALLHAAPKRALVIALGSGATAGALTRHPLDEIDVVELSRGVIAAAPLFAPFNHAPLSDPRVRLIAGDGRQFLRKGARTYDLITTDPINPESAGAGNLYSKEFYELVRSRLNDGGVACQWVPSHYREDEYRMLVRTFSAVFPNTAIWYADATTVLVGSKDTPGVSLGALRRRWTPGVAQSLARVGIDSPETMLSLLLAAPAQTRAFVGTGPLNTDDRPRMEYHDRRPEPGVAEAWEVLADLPAPDFGSVVASWSAADEKGVAAGARALRGLFARKLRRSRAPAFGAPQAERTQFLETESRKYLDGIWTAAEASPAPVYRLMAGLSAEESDREGPARRALLSAARADRRGAPLDALDVLLAAELYSPELEFLPHRMVDMVIRELERSPVKAPAVGRRLLERLPPGRNRPLPEEASDPTRWRLWWTDARFDLVVRGGRFVWKN